MANIKVAHRYAKSLFDLAQERKLTEKIFTDAELLISVCEQNRDLTLLLSNPIVKTDKKYSILKAVFNNAVDALMMSFIEIIVKKGRENYLPVIAAEYVKLYKELNGIKTAFVKTAVPMDADLRAEVMAILKKTQGEKLELVEVVDKDIIGGFVLRVGDNQHDSSISTKLRQLKNEFDDNPYVRGNLRNDYNPIK